jgi:hypothetical protein
MTNAYSTDSQGELVVLNRAQIENDNPRIPTVSSSSTKRDALRLASIYRDPQDVRTVIHLARSGIVLTLLLLTSIAGNFYQYHRRPDRIVVDKSSGRVVEINDRDYGETEAVQLGPEHLTDADKKYIASEFVRSLYQIDPATRSKDIERALRMMLPDSALKFARYLVVTCVGPTRALGCASGFRAYPPRERWVGDAAAYNRSDVRQRLAFLHIPTS